MSEFQYLEFYSTTPLSIEQRDYVSSLSSRSEVSLNRAVFKYSYSDFPADERQVLLSYFDMFLYLSNWGTRRLIFKLPKDLVNYSLNSFKVLG